MNQFYRPAPPLRDERDLDHDTEGMSPSALLEIEAALQRVEYDDGNPATVAVSRRRPAPSPAVNDAPASQATPLAEIPRDAAMDYDDGNPATIVC